MSEASASVIEAVKTRLKPWPDELTRDDYDFSEWVNSIQKLPDDEEQRAWLMAGVFYEYARESYKLRGLLSLEIPSAERDDDDAIRPASFDGLDDATAEMALGKWFKVLLNLANELAGNVPFGKVDPKRVDAALFLRPKDENKKPVRISRLEFEFGRTVWHVPPVAPAFEQDRGIAAGLETMLDWRDALHGEDWPEGLEPLKRNYQPDHNDKECDEVLLLQVNWRDFTDKELGEAFEEFARRFRPSEKFDEPPAKAGPGKRREPELLKHLTALIALRLAHVHSFQDAERAFRWVKSKLGADGAQQERRKFEAKRKQAAQMFATWFPFGERPQHFLPLAQRVGAESK